jgi:hypothetical protein
MTSRQLLFLMARRVYSFAPPLPAVFIMGHMRSGSTLLLHIMLTHPRIIGCGERNRPYESHLDLDKLAIASRLAQRAPFRRVRYAVDQINHDELTPNRDLLEDARVRMIFLVRSPAPTVSSILKLSRAFYNDAWTIERAVDYYARRLRTLAALAAGAAAGRAMAMGYEDLVDDTATMLRKMEAFLGVDTPFREESEVQRFTGTRGDPSGTIQAGQIVRRRMAAADEFPAVALEQATEAYRQYRSAIAESMV